MHRYFIWLVLYISFSEIIFFKELDLQINFLTFLIRRLKFSSNFSSAYITYAYSSAVLNLIVMTSGKAQRWFLYIFLRIHLVAF